jgi:hypothetical protein
MSGQVWIGGELPEISALKARIAELEAASAKDREWVGRALDKQKEYLEQCQTLIAERDAAKAEAEAVIKRFGDPEEAETLMQVVESVWENGDQGWGWAGRLQDDLAIARAGESRAVEALKRIEQQLEWVIDNGDTYQASALIEFVSRIRDNYFSISAQPALDWLAQVKREAAAEACNKAAEHCETTELLMPVPLPGTTLKQHGAAVCMAMAAELRLEAAALRAGKVQNAE